MKSFDWNEIRKHNRDDDCWIVIDGGVYDVSGWHDAHPGGEMINILAGEDASAVFHSSHLTDLTDHLKRFHIGSVRDFKPQFSSMNDRFLATLKARAFTTLTARTRDRKHTPRERDNLIINTIMLISCWACMYLLPPWGLIAAVPMGLVTCSLIGSFGHEQIHGNHYTIRSRRYTFSRFGRDILWGLFIPFMPRCFFQYEHIKHHNHPMDPEQDYDVFALKFFVRLTDSIPRRSYHAFQHLYAPIIYCMYMFLQLLGGYTTGFFARRDLLNDRIHRHEIIVASLSALTFHIMIPLLLTDVIWVLAANAIYFSTWQAAIYITSGLPHMTRISRKDKSTVSWPRYICETTCNLKCGNPFFDWLTGGLNHHLTHHLLPSIPREYLHLVTPDVELTCREFNYPYLHYGSFRKFYRDHYRILRSLGRMDTLTPEREGMQSAIRDDIRLRRT